MNPGFVNVSLTHLLLLKDHQCVIQQDLLVEGQSRFWNVLTVLDVAVVMIRIFHGQLEDRGVVTLFMKIAIEVRKVSV
ncbi:MAG: hypothetical protein RIC35_23925 [Marinoscillum sp.]